MSRPNSSAVALPPPGSIIVPWLAALAIALSLIAMILGTEPAAGRSGASTLPCDPSPGGEEVEEGVCQVTSSSIVLIASGTDESVVTNDEREPDRASSIPARTNETAPDLPAGGSSQTGTSTGASRGISGLLSSLAGIAFFCWRLAYAVQRGRRQREEREERAWRAEAAAVRDRPEWMHAGRSRGDRPAWMAAETSGDGTLPAWRRKP
jgi:hypothetical protein